MKRTGKFTNNTIASFPFSLASKEDQDIYSPESVPDGFVLSDPDHLTGTQIESLYLHWLGRQQKKLSPFIMLKASPQHQTTVRMSEKAKGKRKIPYHDVVTSDEGEGSRDGSDVPAGDENDEDEDDKGEEEISPGVKRGPPNRNSMKKQHSSQKVGEPVASSSKLPRTPKKKRKPVNEVSPVSPARPSTPGPSGLHTSEILEPIAENRQSETVGRKVFVLL